MPHAHPLAPRFWVFHLVALVLVGTAGWLGYWQYDAWQERRAAESENLTSGDPVELDDVMGADDAFPGDAVGQKVILRGTWLPSGTVLVRDRGPGFWVATPLTVGPGDTAIMVVRGATASRDAVPPPPSGEAEVVGWLQPPEGTGATDDDPTDDVLPQLRIADALQHVDVDLYGAYAVATGEWAVNGGADGLTAASPDQLPEVGRFTALRNVLYAVEWWIFGLFAAFVWWRWVRDLVEGDEEAAEPAP